MEIVKRVVNYCKSGRIADRITVERHPDIDGAWRYRRRNIGGVNLVSNVNWNSAVEAAGAAALVVASERGKSKLDLQGSLRDTMLTKWQLEGIQAYRNGQPWRCWNNYMREAYNAAKAEGVAVFGWPTPMQAEVTA